MAQPTAHAMTTVDGFLTITRTGPEEWQDVTFSFFGDDGSEAFIAVPAWKLVQTLVDLGLASGVKG